MIKIKIDTKDFQDKIKTVKRDIPKIAKKLMAYVFTKMRKDIRANISSNFKRRKGWLRADLNYWAFDDFSGSIASYNNKRQGAYYASVLEKGATITAKKDKYLTIYMGKDSNDNPVYRKVKSVVIPPRPYFKPVADDYWGGGGYKAGKLMDEGLQKIIDKYVEKKGGGLVVADNGE
jgi:hypothetical protein